MKYVNQKGFTLLEVMFASVIMAISLLGFSILQFHNTKSSRNALDQVWAQQNVRQLIENMISNTQAMSAKSIYSDSTNNTYYTATPTTTLKDVDEGYNTLVSSPKTGCYTSGEYAFGRDKTNTGSEKYEIDANEGSDGDCENNLLAARDYVFNMVLSDSERFLNKANIKITCQDSANGDDYRCTPGGSRIDVYLSWSRDSEITDMSEIKGCSPGVDTNGNTAGFSSDMAKDGVVNNIDSGVQCAVYSFFY